MASPDEQRDTADTHRDPGQRSRIRAGRSRPAALEASGHAAELVVVQTAGDVRAPDTAWGEGAFVAAIERALLDGRADVAVHSAKDVPVAEDPRLTIAAYLAREDARDALVTRAGSTVMDLRGPADRCRRRHR